MRRPRFFSVLALTLAGAVVLSPAASAFVNNNRSWPSSLIVMQLQLGASGSLINGCPSWGCAFERAMAEWNLYLNRSQFFGVRDSSAPIEDYGRIFSVARSPSRT